MINTIRLGGSYLVAARFIHKGAPLWEDICLLWDAAIKSHCTAKRGKAAQLTLVNYLGMVRGIQPECAEAGRLLTGAWCRRGDRRDII